MTSLPESARRVRAAAQAAGLDVDVVEMPTSTRTAEEAARACGCAVGQIVKSLVFAGAESGRIYLLLVSGANRVDEKGAARETGEALLRPDAARVREATGFAIGGVPPLGHAMPLATFMDEDLLRFEIVWAAAGTPNAVFAVHPRLLQAATGARSLRVAR
jgi:prolyl-tRNA editing enzyme YbaK/EbsC (Cys-tRNA(Pro) deacylase)